MARTRKTAPPAAVGDFNDDASLTDPHADGVAPAGDVVLAPVPTTPTMSLREEIDLRLVETGTILLNGEVHHVPKALADAWANMREKTHPVIDVANAALDAVAKEEGYARLPEGNALLALVLADPTVAFKVYDAVKSGSVKSAKWKQVTAGRHHLETYPGGATLGIVVTSLNDSRKWVPEWDRGAFAGPESDLDGAKAWLAERAARAGYPVM